MHNEWEDIVVAERVVEAKGLIMFKAVLCELEEPCPAVLRIDCWKVGLCWSGLYVDIMGAITSSCIVTF